MPQKYLTLYYTTRADLESPQGGSGLIILKVLDKDECGLTSCPVFYRIVRFQIYLPGSGLIYTAGHKMSGFEKHQEYV